MNLNVLSASSNLPLLAKYIGESGMYIKNKPNKTNGDTVTPNNTRHDCFGKIVHAKIAEIILPNDQKNSKLDK